jgi:hypothetical protein
VSISLVTSSNLAIKAYQQSYVASNEEDEPERVGCAEGTDDVGVVMDILGSIAKTRGLVNAKRLDSRSSYCEARRVVCSMFSREREG